MTFQKFTPMEYLMIDVANNYGLDKTNWDHRIAWFKENEDNLDALVKEAEAPALFYAGLKAYRQAKEGQSISYPISLDATASGAQILAVLVGCRKSAMLCNVVDAGQRMDLYTAIYEIMQGTLAEEAGDDQEVVEGLNVTRKDVKQAIMTSLYGSTAQPKRVFGEGDLLNFFYEIMETKATGIWRLNQAILSLWQSDALSHDWVMPDNFHVHVKVMDRQDTPIKVLGHSYIVTEKVNRPTDTGLSLGANTVHSIDGMIVREISRRCDYDPGHMIELIEMIMHSSYERNVRADRDKDKLVKTLWDHYERSGFLSARILELLDHKNMALVDYSVILEMIKTLPTKPFKVMAIHDCFRVHPNYGNDLRAQYNQLLHEIAKSELMAFIASQITKDVVIVPKFGDIADDVLQANYALS